MGKSTISMAMFNSYVNLPEGKELTFDRQGMRHYALTWLQVILGMFFFPKHRKHSVSRISTKTTCIDQDIQRPWLSLIPYFTPHSLMVLRVCSFNSTKSDVCFISQLAVHFYSHNLLVICYLSKKFKIAISSEFSHETWWFSITP